MKQTFWSAVWDAFTRVYGIPAFVVGVGITLITAWLKPDTAVPLVWVVIVGLCLVCLLLALGALAHEAHSKYYQAISRPPAVPELPKVLRVKANRDGTLTLLVEPSDWFYQDSVVSCLYDETGFEERIGIGYVQIIQTGGVIQVHLATVSEAHRTIIERIVTNDKLELGRLKVKPGEPRVFNSDRGW